MSLAKYTISQLPRLLTQLDRDPDSSTFGNFDRNYWHYKIRDFPSSILQQSCVALSYLPKLLDVSPSASQLWLEGSLKCWARMRNKGGGLEEYYPYEQSYPATAFSLQAVTYCLLRQPKLMNEYIDKQVNVASQFLINNFESRALNQQAAGIAALAQAKQLGYAFSKVKYKNIVSRFFKSQSKEGWFPEYDGPDLGYLSVTLDMLWDYFQSSKDERAVRAMDLAVEFIETFITTKGHVLIIANSRETDYLVPYGLFQLSTINKKASTIAKFVFSQIDSSHFLRSIDDRYSSHYILNSCIKASQIKLPKITGKFSMTEKFLPLSGIYVRRKPKEQLVIAGYKGGSYQLAADDADYGYRCYRQNQVWASHIWNKQLNINYQDNQLTIMGCLTPVEWLVSSPIKHFFLRLLSFVFGKKIVGYIKQRMIFYKPDNSFLFIRRFNFDKKQVVTQISGPKHFQVKPGIKQPIRHVASAFQYSPLDALSLAKKSQKVRGKFTQKKRL